MVTLFPLWQPQFIKHRCETPFWYLNLKESQREVSFFRTMFRMINIDDLLMNKQRQLKLYWECDLRFAQCKDAEDRKCKQGFCFFVYRGTLNICQQRRAESGWYREEPKYRLAGEHGLNRADSCYVHFSKLVTYASRILTSLFHRNNVKTIPRTLSFLCWNYGCVYQSKQVWE